MRQIGTCLFCTLLLLAGCTKVEAPSVDPIHQAAIELDSKNFGRVIELTTSIIAAGPTKPQAYYLRAQALAMSGDLHGAIDALENAFKSGWKDFSALPLCRNLDPLRAQPQYRALLEKYDPSSAPKITISDKEIKAGDASIKEIDGQQVIKAGDIELTVPK